MQRQDPEVQSFLEELTDLSRKYKIYIGGCGCCGSPHLNKIKEDFLNINSISCSDFYYTVDGDLEHLDWTSENEEDC